MKIKYKLEIPKAMKHLAAVKFCTLEKVGDWYRQGLENTYRPQNIVKRELIVKIKIKLKRWRFDDLKIESYVILNTCILKNVRIHLQNE